MTVDKEVSVASVDADRLLAQAHLTVISADCDGELAVVHDAVAHKALVANRTELEALMCALVDAAGRSRATPVPKTLDFVGHTAPGTGLLALGQFTVDAASQVVTSFFRGLAEHDVLRRLGVHAVRLLGSLTAATPLGHATVCALSEILGMEVIGTKNLIYGAHFAAGGWQGKDFVLARASDLRREIATNQPLLAGEPAARGLDVDGLPAVRLDELGTARWPRRVASVERAGELLRLVRRGEGRAMPGLLTKPSCEVALPAALAGSFHVAQVLLDGAYVRVMPEGAGRPGVCYPVADPRELMAIVDAMASAAAAG